MHLVILCLFAALLGLSVGDDHDQVCTQIQTASHKLHLKYDHALFQIKLRGDDPTLSLSLGGMSSLCYHCNLIPCAHSTDFVSVIVDTNFEYKYQIRGNTQFICNGSYHFEEHGHYLQYILYNPTTQTYTCADIIETKKHNFVYLPLVVMIAILVGLVILYNILMLYMRRQALKRQIGYSEISGDSDRLSGYETSGTSQYGSNPVANTSTYTPLNGRPVAKSRIKSLDTFRGISIVMMIFVNYTGGRYWFFNHSSWNGLTVADLVFPWFIFMMGSSIFISFRSLRRKHVSKKAITLKILYRTVKLLVLGLFLNNGLDLSNWRLPGVLQRFALSYFVVAMVNMLFSPEEDEIDTHYNYDWRDLFRDITWFPLQHLFMALLLAVYLLITFLVHDPDCPKGYLGPGGYGDYGKYFNCTGGAAKYIDVHVFGLNHIYQGPTCQFPYQCVAHDPEGLLGVIPSIFLTYLGLQASRILFLYSKQKSHIVRWLVWAVLLGCIAIGLCGGTQNDGIIPINKNLWSLSFILATGSLAFLVLTICYVLVDVKHWWSGSPFYFAGMNAILLYVGHEVFRDYFPFGFNGNDQHSELLTRAAVGTGLWVIIAYICFRKAIFLKL